jgi:hypothetical protein
VPRDAHPRRQAAKNRVFPLVEKRICAGRGIAADAKLEEGFFPENFALAEVVYLSDEGVHFYYNVYEIACYAAGGDDVTIPWAEYPADALPPASPAREFLPK